MTKFGIAYACPEGSRPKWAKTRWHLNCDTSSSEHALKSHDRHRRCHSDGRDPFGLAAFGPRRPVHNFDLSSALRGHQERRAEVVAIDALLVETQQGGQGSSSASRASRKQGVPFGSSFAVTGPGPPPNTARGPRRTRRRLALPRQLPAARRSSPQRRRSANTRRAPRFPMLDSLNAAVEEAGEPSSIFPCWARRWCPNRCSVPARPSRLPCPTRMTCFVSPRTSPGQRSNNRNGERWSISAGVAFTDAAGNARRLLSALRHRTRSRHTSCGARECGAQG